MNWLSNFITKYHKWIIIFIIIVTAFFGYSLRNIKFNDDMMSYLPDTYEDIRYLNEVNEKFGGVSTSFIGIESNNIFTYETLTKIKTLTEELEKLDGIKNVTSIINMVEIKGSDLGIETSPLIEGDIPTDKAKLEEFRQKLLGDERYNGNIISSNGEVTILMFNPAGFVDSEILSKRVKEISEKTLTGEKIYYAGPIMLIQYIQDSMGRDLYTLLPLSVLLVMLTLFYCFKSIRGVLLPLISVVVSTIWTIGLIALITGELSMISVIIPILLVAIGSAYGIHSLSRYYEVITAREDKKEGIKSLVRAISIPIIMTGITTMIGFLCLSFSNLDPIKIFGIYSAFGILSALFNAIFLIPSILLVLKVKKSRTEGINPGKESFLIRGMDRLSVFVLKKEVLIAIIAGVLLVGGFVGLTFIKTETNMEDMFPKKSEPGQAFQLIRDEFGGSIFLQMVVKGDIKNPIVLKQMLDIETFLDSKPELSKSSSIADYIAEMNDIMNGTRKIPDTREGVANLLFFLEGNDILKRMVTHDYDEAIIQVKLAELSTEEIKRIAGKIHDYIESNLTKDFIEISLYEKNQLIADLGTNAFDRFVDYGLENKIAQITRKISNLINSDKYGEEISKTLRNGLNSYDFLTESFKDVLLIGVEDYLNSFEAEIIIEDVKQLEKTVKDIGASLAERKYSEESFYKVLSSSLPKEIIDDDPEGIQLLAASLSLIVRDEIGRQRVNEITDKLSAVIPTDLYASNSSKIRNSVLDINDRTYAVSQEDFSKHSDKTIESSSINYRLTGFPVLIESISDNLTRSLYISLLLAIVVVYVLMSIEFKSLVGGLISLIPVVLTICINFGIMGIANITLNIGTTMIASVAVGIGIDYSIHFSSRFKREFQTSGNELEALRITLETTGKAIVFNALSVALGFLVLIFSSMSPIKEFGGLMAGVMIVSALTSITVLPAVILITKASFVEKKKSEA